MNDELLKQLAQQILETFNIKDQEKFEQEARQLDQELLRNKISLISINGLWKEIQFVREKTLLLFALGNKI